MEKVQFQLEATLPELKDLHEKGLFSRTEINQITKRRTGFETSLVRQVARKEDFFKYASYEINLERLRKVRWKKLKYHLNPPPPSASTYSLPRRALYILKRATAKFPADLAVWLAYVEFAAREGMRKVVGKGLTSALQYHPTSSTLYLLQTYYHLHPGSPFPRSAIPSTSKLDLPSASNTTNTDGDNENEDEETGFAIEGITQARTTLLLGLRLLPQSRDLWREYIKLELGWVEALRRRWKLLGINAPSSSKSTIEGDSEGFDGDAEALAGGQGAFGPEGEDARKEILAGQLVVHAITSALEAISPSTPPTNEDGDGMVFRQGLLEMFRHYPSPLRTKCLNVLYDDLKTIASNSRGREAAVARLVVMTRGLYDIPYDPDHAENKPIGQGQVALDGLELVEEIGKIGKEIRKTVKGKENNTAWLEVVGGWVLDRIDELSDNDELRQYLLSMLTSLTKPSIQPPPEILLRHLALLSDPAEALSIARSYAAVYSKRPDLQIIRLQAEVSNANAEAEALRKTCQEVVTIVTKSDNLRAEDWSETESLWRIWFDWEIKIINENQSNDIENRLKDIVKLSLRLGGSLPNLHGAVLGWYFTCMIMSGKSSRNVLSEIRSNYRPSFSTFEVIFKTISSGNAVIPLSELDGIYEAWRSVCQSSQQRVKAVLIYADLLVTEKKGKKAYDVIRVVGAEVRGGESEGVLDEGWKRIVDEQEQQDKEEEDEDEDEDMEE